MESIQSILEAVSKAAVSARKLSKNQKQIILTDLASALISNSEKIIQENRNPTMNALKLVKAEIQREFM